MPVSNTKFACVIHFLNFTFALEILLYAGSFVSKTANDGIDSVEYNADKLGR